MTKSNRSDRRNAAPASFSKIHETWATNLSNVYKWGSTNEVDAVELRLKHRGGGDWVGIAKRVGDDGAPEVLFANGFDLVSCLIALNGAMSGDRWRVDRPWTPPTGVTAGSNDLPKPVLGQKGLFDDH